MTGLTYENVGKLDNGRSPDEEGEDLAKAPLRLVTQLSRAVSNPLSVPLEKTQ